jgi:hypothetical protein
MEQNISMDKFLKFKETDKINDMIAKITAILPYTLQGDDKSEDDMKGCESCS